MTEINHHFRPRGLQSNDAAGMTDIEIQRLRFEDDATRILENDLKRLRWSAPIRDAIAKSLAAIVERERRLTR